MIHLHHVFLAERIATSVYRTLSTAVLLYYLFRRSRRPEAQEQRYPNQRLHR